jgi:predicted metal-dependent phosphoesterase TrpH
VLARAQQSGLGRIAITDHNRLDVALEMAGRHPDRVIPGEEVKTAEGVDIIGLYLSEEIPKGTPAADTCRMIRAQGGIVYLPHPYAPGKGGSGRLAERLAPELDVVEIFNGRLHDPARDQSAVALADRHRRLRGAGSDAHTLGEIGRTWIEVPFHPNEPRALMEALREGVIHGTKASRFVHLASTWAKLRKKLPGA